MSTRILKSKSVRLAIAVAIVIIVIALGCLALMKGCSHTAGKIVDEANRAYDLCHRIAGDIDSVVNLRPKITCSGTTVVEASSSIAELSTVEKPFEHTYYYEVTWLGSTKRITLRAQFIAKAGYDLKQPIMIDVSGDEQSIRVIMPRPQINSVEQTSVDILQDEDGWWNKISADDREQALNSLLAEAKKSLDETTLLADAEFSLQTQLDQVIRKNAPPSAKITHELMQ